tara:strand:+ start:1223 stop:3991 length:2769 start_codon:yes stop_codon:yes gene_type:complete
MSFIKLDRKDFASTKIKNKFKTSYISNQENTLLTDNNNDSKSIVCNHRMSVNNVPTDLFDVEDTISIKESISEFLNVASQEEASYEEISELKNNLFTTNNITNENLKLYNVRNKFEVKRNTQNFLVDDFNLSKLNTVKNSIYDFYKKDMTKDYYPNLEFGFVNYNSINFFKNKIQNTKNHSNCIVYSNHFNQTSSKNEIDLNNNFNINFWINVRENNQNKKGCVLHLPEVLSLYSVEFEEKFMLCLTSGDESKKELVTQNFNEINFGQEENQSMEGCYLFAESVFDYNKWYNVNLRFIKNSDTSNDYNLLVSVDDLEIYNSTIQIDSSIGLNFNSYLCIGNKPDYSTAGGYNTQYEKIFYTFFGEDLNANDSEGPFYKKDINLGKNIEYLNSQNLNINTIESDGFNVVFLDNENSSSFLGEIHDIKIYSQSISKEKTSFLSKNNLSDLTVEIEEGLCFYVPCFYVPTYIKKQGLFNNSINNTNLYFSNMYNPFYANSCGGLDISVENFLAEFVNHKKPNVIISGNELQNITGNFLEIEIQSKSIDWSKEKIGFFASDIFVEKLVSDNIDSDLNYKNFLMLPCDNGIPNIDFTSIQHFIDNSTLNFKIDSIDYEIINCEDCISKNFIVNESDFQGDKGRRYHIRLENSETVRVSTQSNIAYNVSNFIYHDNRLLDNDSILSNAYDQRIHSYATSVNDKYNITKSNPVLRKSDDGSSPTGKIILEDTVIYKELPLPYYDFNNSKLNMFNVMFEIPNAYFNNKIVKGSLEITDENIISTGGGIKIKLKDNKNGFVYRGNCLTKQAEWNYVGNCFYKEGIICINNPFLYYFGKTSFNMTFSSESSLFIHQTDVVIPEGQFNKSLNSTYNNKLRMDESAFNSDEPFVYISDINLHDENFNIVAKAKLTHPIPKKNTDDILVRLKMDY